MRNFNIICHAGVFARNYTLIRIAFNDVTRRQVNYRVKDVFIIMGFIGRDVAEIRTTLTY